MTLDLFSLSLSLSLSCEADFDIPLQAEVDSEGNLFLVGITASSDFPFPSSSGPLNVSDSSAQCESIMSLVSEDLSLPESVSSKPLPEKAEAACRSDVFVARFDSNGSLVSSHIFGGPGADMKPSFALLSRY